jgi:uncharacterized SAM-binding protein YcdF (DUF218 family)
MTLIIAAILVVFALLRLWQQWRRRHEKTAWWWFGWIVPFAALAAVPLLALHAPGAQDAPGMLQLRKTLALLAMPAGLTWLALIAGAVVCQMRGQKFAAGIIAAICLLYTVSGNIWLGHWLMQSLEDQVPEAQPAEVAKAGPLDIVCVLGGGTSWDRDGVAEAGTAGDRVLYAAQLFQQGRCRHLGCSGATIPGISSSRSLATDTAYLWKQLGIPDEAIIQVEGDPRVTGTEVAAIQAECARRGYTRVGLLSSGWHLPRTLAHAKRLGFSVIPIAADRVGPSPGANPMYLIPQGGGFESVQMGIWERLGKALGQ